MGKRARGKASKNDLNYDVRKGYFTHLVIDRGENGCLVVAVVGGGEDPGGLELSVSFNSWEALRESRGDNEQHRKDRAQSFLQCKVTQ